MRKSWLIVVGLAITFGVTSIGPGRLVSSIQNLRKEKMPDMANAEIIAVFEDACGDGRAGALKIRQEDGVVVFVAFFLGDDPEHPFAVVNRRTNTVYVDLDRDGKVDEAREATGGPCDDAARVPKKISKTGPAYPRHIPKTVTM